MTTAQVLSALESANRIRNAMVEVKREIAAGQLDIPGALVDERAAPMRLGALLAAQRRWGTTKVDALCRTLTLNQQRRVRELTPRQRRVLVDHFNPQPKPTPVVPVVPAPPREGMEPERVDARVLAALVLGPVTRTELGLRLREMQLPVDDLDAALARLWVRRAVMRRESGDGFELYDVGPYHRESA